jgi:hypothetical protein
LAIACRADYAGFDLLAELGEDWPGVLSGAEPAWSSLPGDLPDLIMPLVRSDPGAWSMEMTWDPAAATLAQVATSATEGDQMVVWRYASAPPRVVVEAADAARVAPEGALLDRAWAWQLSGLPFQLPYGGKVDLVRVDASGDVHVYPAFVQIMGGEPVWTPAGTLTTWKVTVTYTNDAGDERVLAAWYQAQAPYVLVRYDDGAVSYVLADVD